MHDIRIPQNRVMLKTGKYFRLLTVIVCLVVAGCAGSRAVRPEKRNEYFSNPVLPPLTCDPWITFHNGFYYYCYSTGRMIYLRKTADFTRLSNAEPELVWMAPESGPNSQNVWAPELHFIDGSWYIYYCADDGRNENHRIFILQSETKTPLGPYSEKGMLDTDGWAIDGTVYQDNDSQKYFLWSGWTDENRKTQGIFIAPMKTPAELAGPGVCISYPEKIWEKAGHPICEAPQVMKGKSAWYVIYSAGGSWTPHYCLGMLVNESGNLTDPRSWTKSGPVFESIRGLWGVGHCCFTTSPDGTEDWIIYHAKTGKEEGWGDRCVCAQQFLREESGRPVFGKPVPLEIKIIKPSD